jgi:hypothetical protein
MGLIFLALFVALLYYVVEPLICWSIVLIGLLLGKASHVPNAMGNKRR